jgi:hypothetical protein
VANCFSDYLPSANDPKAGLFDSIYMARLTCQHCEREHGAVSGWSRGRGRGMAADDLGLQIEFFLHFCQRNFEASFKTMCAWSGCGAGLQVLG